MLANADVGLNESFITKAQPRRPCATCGPPVERESGEGGSCMIVCECLSHRARFAAAIFALVAALFFRSRPATAWTACSRFGI
jgi:hypothetical protein